MGLMKRIMGMKSSGSRDVTKMPVLGMRYDSSRSFFNAKRITDAAGRASHKALRHFGGYVRKVAKSLIRSRKGYSKPGHPPHSHSGILKRFIFFFHDRTYNSVIIGPTLLPQGRGAHTVPEVLEHGGTRPRKSKSGRHKTARYKKRPYMQPAFDIGKRNVLPKLWIDSVK